MFAGRVRPDPQEELTVIPRERKGKESKRWMEGGERLKTIPLVHMNWLSSP